MILHALGRLIVVPLGMLLGSITAAVVLATLGLELASHELAASADDGARLEILMGIGLGFANIAAAATVLPALLIVIAGEVARIRSALYYVCGGGMSLASLPIIAAWGMPGAGAAPMRVWTAMATAGFAGGLVYWLVAGRSS